MDGFDLAAIRKRNGVTQKELADRAGIDKFRMSGIENNTPPATEEYLLGLVAIVEALAAERSKAAVA